MPKRQNPFGDSSPLQFKAHIGKKEVDMGVNAGENMEAVYEKTRSALFAGARRTNRSGSCQLLTEETSSAVELPHPLPGQLRLSSSGKLCSDQQSMDVQQQDPAGPLGSVKFTEGFFNNNNYQMGHLPQGQCRIDPMGHLTRDVKGVKPCPFQGAGQLPNQCLTCRHISTTLSRCHFCDKGTCVSCLRTCHACHGTYCQVCSVLNYEDCSERAFCLQCST